MNFGESYGLVICAVLVFAFILLIFFRDWIVLECISFAVRKVPGLSWQQGDFTEKNAQAAHFEAVEVSQLPSEGDVLELNFSDKEETSSENEAFTVVTYNIFLGLFLHELLTEFDENFQDADVIFLQEDNVFKDPRTETFRSIGATLARSLKMYYYFTPAYFRFDKNGRRGCYGISILTRHKPDSYQSIECRIRPRIVEELTTKGVISGWRHMLMVEVFGTALVSAHFPSAGKFSEFQGMVHDLFDNLSSVEKPIVIGGDFNTLAYVARVVPCVSGKIDMCCSCSSESTLFRKLLSDSDYLSVFDYVPTHESWSAQLDWILINRTSEYIIDQISQSKDGRRQRASDHLWLKARLSKCLQAHHRAKMHQKCDG